MFWLMMWLIYLVVGLVLALVSLFLTFVLYIWYIHKKYEHIPSPKRPSFFTGHFSQLSENENKEESQLCPLSRSIQEWSEEAGKLFVIFLLWKPLVITLNAEDVKELQTRVNIRKSDRMLSLQALMGERFLGKSVMTLRDYDSWKPLRTMQNPAFAESFLMDLLPKFNESAEQFLNKLLPSAVKKTQVLMRDEAYEMALETIFWVCLSVDINDAWKAQSKDFPWAKDMKYIDVMNLTNDAILAGVKFGNLYGYIHPYKAKHYQNVAKAARAPVRVCIQDRIKAIQRGDDVPRDLMSNIIKTGLMHGNEDVEGYIDTMLSYVVGELETVANTLVFAIVLLCRHPDVMDRLITEVTEVLGDKKSVDEEDLKKLQYTEQVVAETQRLYPAIAGVTKESPGIELSGYYIPKGSTIYLDCNNSCRLPENFDDPDTFNPSRFDPSKIRPSPFVYFPLSAGHRSCIGKIFAMMELKISLSKLLHKFQIKLPREYKFVVTQHTTLRTSDALPCLLEQRR